MVESKFITQKNIDFHESNAFFIPLQPERVISHKTLLEFSWIVVLDNGTSLSMVANQLELIMQNSEFEHIRYTLDCSRADCRVVFSTTDDDKNGLTKLTNERFFSIWK